MKKLEERTIVKTTKAILRIISILIVVFSLLTTIASAQSIPDEVETALTEYASLDPISIQWEGAERIDYRGVNSETPIASIYSRQGHCFSWMYNRLGIVRSDKPLGDPVVEKNNYRFDGDVVFATFGTDFASMYRIAELIETSAKSSRFDLPYFEAVGIYCPIRHGDLPKEMLQSNILYLLQTGAELVSCDEIQLEQETVVRIEIDANNPAWDQVLENQDKNLEYDKSRLGDDDKSRKKLDEILKAREVREATMPRKLRYVYYLSPNNRYAVRKHERLTLEGRVTSSYSNSSFQSIPGTDIVLAGKVTKKTFEYVGSHNYELLKTPFHIVDLSVMKVSTDAIPQGQFSRDMDEVAPGATVVDGTNPDLRLEDGHVAYYEMPASPEDLDVAIARVVAKNRSRPNLRFGFIIANLAIIVFIGYCIYAKRNTFNK